MRKIEKHDISIPPRYFSILTVDIFRWPGQPSRTASILSLERLSFIFYRQYDQQVFFIRKWSDCISGILGPTADIWSYHLTHQALFMSRLLRSCFNSQSSGPVVTRGYTRQNLRRRRKKTYHIPSWDLRSHEEAFRWEFCESIFSSIAASRSHELLAWVILRGFFSLGLSLQTTAWRETHIHTDRQAERQVRFW